MIQQQNGVYMWPRLINIGKAIAKFGSFTKAAELAETMSGKVTIIGVTIHQIQFIVNKSCSNKTS